MDADRRAANRRGGQVDDDAPGAGRDHGPRRGLRHECAALEVDAEHAVPLGFGHLQEVDPREDPGIVDQHVDPAERRDGALHDSLADRDAADITLDQRGVATDGAHPGGNGFGIRLVVQPVDRDVVAGRREGQGAGGPDALLRPGDQHHLLRHRRLHPMLRRSMGASGEECHLGSVAR